jgi:Polysaccharide deacetylase
MRRRWGPIVTGVALALTFGILVGLGTLGPGAPGENDPAAQSSDAPPGWMRKLRPGEKPPQFVLFSFDGAGSHDHWSRILPLADKAHAQVTGFLSGVYLLPDERRREYTGPGHAPGTAAISFGGSTQEVDTRVADLNDAVARGHEIGTHYNGHFCAGNEPSVGHWTTAQWNDELDQFDAFVRDGVTHGLQATDKTIKGGRTPCLEGNFDALAPALAEHGLTYDASRTSVGIAWPQQRRGIWEFAVPVVRVPALGGQKVVMADYNLWYALNGAREDPSRDREFTDVTLDTYRAAYQAALNTNRAPLTIATHFNDWSGGAFSAATERFLSEVCVRDNTVCTTYSHVIEWMKQQDPAVLDSFRTMPHAQVT